MPRRAGRYFSPEQVAERFAGYKPEAIRVMCRRGEMEAFKAPNGHRVMIPERAVVAWEKKLVPVAPAERGG